MKLNLGAGPYWEKKGWHVLDHKLKKNENDRVAGDISSIKLKSNLFTLLYHKNPR